MRGSFENDGIVAGTNFARTEVFKFVSRVDLEYTKEKLNRKFNWDLVNVVKRRKSK